MSTPNPQADQGHLPERVRELEEQIASLQTKLARKGPKPSPGSKLEIRQAASLVLPLGVTVLAAIPGALVIRDRWLGIRWASPLLDRWWTILRLNTLLSLPSYILVIAACMISVIILMLVSRNRPLVFFSPLQPSPGAQPSVAPPAAARRVGTALIALGSLVAAVIAVTSGAKNGWMIALGLLIYFLGWVLREIDWRSIKDAWKLDGDFWTVLLLSHLSFTAGLASWVGGGNPGIIPSILLLISCVLLYRYRQRIPPVFWIANLAILLGALYLDAWRFSTIGDEFSFYQTAREINTKISFAALGQDLFSGTYVYGSHPFFSSLIQGVFMKIYGLGGFGWRFSNVYLVGIGVGLIFLFLRRHVPKVVAIVAGFVLATSAYLLAFGKIGYNNLQSFFALALVLATGAHAAATRTTPAYVLAALATGVCFYVFPGALYVVPLAILYLAMFDPPRTRASAVHWGIYIATVLLLFVPLAVQPNYFSSKVAGTLFYNAGIVQSTASLIHHLASNLIYSILSFIYIPNETHFVSTSYADPIGSVFILVGLAYSLKAGSKSRFGFFMLAGYLWLLVTAGVSHDRDFPPTTRMFLLVPWFSLFAAIGIYWLVVEWGGRLVALPAWVLPALVALVVASNTYQAYHVDPYRTAQYQNMEAMGLRVAQDAAQIDPAAKKTLFFLVPQNWSALPFAEGLEQIYGFSTNEIAVQQAVIGPDDISRGTPGNEAAILPTSSYPLIQDQNTITVIVPAMDPTYRQPLSNALTQLGRTSCDVHKLGGNFVFSVWHSGKFGALCSSTNVPP